MAQKRIQKTKVKRKQTEVEEDSTKRPAPRDYSATDKVLEKIDKALRH